jgi:hypothetical protein
VPIGLVALISGVATGVTSATVVGLVSMCLALSYITAVGSLTAWPVPRAAVLSTARITFTLRRLPGAASWPPAATG